MALNIFTMLCTYYHYYTLKLFIIPRRRGRERERKVVLARLKSAMCNLVPEVTCHHHRNSLFIRNKSLGTSHTYHSTSKSWYLKPRTVSLQNSYFSPRVPIYDLKKNFSCVTNNHNNHENIVLTPTIFSELIFLN